MSTEGLCEDRDGDGDPDDPAPPIPCDDIEIKICLDVDGNEIPATPIIDNGCVVGYFCPDASPPRDPDDNCPVILQQYCYDPTTGQIYIPDLAIGPDGCPVQGTCEDRDGDGNPDGPFPPIPCQDIQKQICILSNGTKVPALPVVDSVTGCVVDYRCVDGGTPIDPPDSCPTVFQQYCYDKTTGEIYLPTSRLDANGCPVQGTCEDRDGDGNPDGPFPPSPCEDVEVKICFDIHGKEIPATPITDSRGCITGYTCPEPSPPRDPDGDCPIILQTYC